MPPRVVVASDSFKGSLTSVEVGAAVRSGLLDRRADTVVDVVPVADGGEGTVDAALAAGFRAVPAAVHGPTAEPVRTTLAERDGVVVLELADACGLGRLPGRTPRPLAASSRGLGEALRAALDLAPRTMVVGVGGSASTDGGAGMLTALGARVLDPSGAAVPEGGGDLGRAATTDLTGLDPRLRGVRLVLAADVRSPLLGPDGAAAVFGPQKGATPDDVAVLEASLATWAGLLAPDLVGTPGAGAAGGVGFALLALGAEHRSGVDVVLDLVGLDALLDGADLVVTGEGWLDAQTSSGKAVTGVVRRATAAGVPVVAVCGRTTLTEDEVAGLGLAAAHPLTDLEPDPRRCVAEAADLLRAVGARLAEERLSAPA
ncbi:glycerate kinase [Phycicoccus sp. CSK15P-2]|uniref:glycerate kinase n=1 Tax=Phycicoccus sp. CSK15P-2 TaxID=2807627 RepID=UPI00194F03F7|nr:glycerate kinase [Phycicoccus sp. CSK15P-2]MBM6405371.1 glycerate kinase [Phycicoccus sp. CSK15P-2]